VPQLSPDAPRFLADRRSPAMPSFCRPADADGIPKTYFKGMAQRTNSEQCQGYMINHFAGCSLKY
jgi:hypothetical protein